MDGGAIMTKLYVSRSTIPPRVLDEAGGYYARHVEHMTSEWLHEKSDIARELGFRDMLIDRLYDSLRELYGFLRISAWDSEVIIPREVERRVREALQWVEEAW